MIQEFLLSVWPPDDRHEKALYMRALAKCFECDVSLVRSAARDLFYDDAYTSEPIKDGPLYVAYAPLINHYRYPAQLSLKKAKDNASRFVSPKTRQARLDPVTGAMFEFFKLMAGWLKIDPAQLVLNYMDRCLGPDFIAVRIKEVLESFDEDDIRLSEGNSPIDDCIISSEILEIREGARKMIAA